jgi:DNA repair exonuclease SbcCD ATPase subunit
MSDPADEAESDISEASSDIQKDESTESDWNSEFDGLKAAFAQDARDRGLKSNYDQVLKDFKTAESDGSDEEIRAVSKELDTLEDAEAERVKEFGEEAEEAEDLESGTQAMIANLDEAEEDMGEALQDLGGTMRKAAEAIDKDALGPGNEAANNLKRTITDVVDVADVQGEAEKEAENIIEDLANLEKGDNMLERFERNMEAQFRKEEGLIQELGQDAQELSDEELLKKAREEDKKLGKLKEKLKEDERITEEAEERLGQEIEEMRGEMLKMENVEESLENRADPETSQNLEEIAQTAAQGASRLKDEISAEESKLGEEESEVKQLEANFGNLSASSDGLSAGIESAGTVVVVIVAALAAATLLL